MESPLRYRPWISHPVLDLQSLGAPELALVVGDRHARRRSSVRGNPQIVVANGRARPFQRAADFAVVHAHSVIALTRPPATTKIHSVVL